MRRWWMFVVVAVLAAGCYPNGKGKQLEEWATAHYEWSVQVYTKVILPLYDSTKPLPAESMVVFPHNQRRHIEAQIEWWPRF